MPHSSGGGSHGGGFHSSSVGHSGGSGHSEPKHHTRHRSFAGCRTYYGYAHNKPVYIYTDYDLADNCRTKKFSWAIFLYSLLIVSIVLVALKVTFVTQSTKLKTNTGDYVAIEDEIGIVDKGEYSKLSQEINTLYEKTGVATQVLFINNEDWMPNYTSLEAYAYEQYVTRFGNDETMWLLVYSEPEVVDKSFNTWYWEGMIGDNTTRALPQSMLDGFNSSVQSNLYTYSPADSISLALSELNENAGKTKIEPMGIFAFGLVGFLYLLGLVRDLIEIARAKQYKKYKELIGTHKEATCKYCNGVYIQGETTCPHCGASITNDDWFY